ncbi:hypothetical protein [Thermoflavimicrobium daqui]|jgi:hypothetical protein|uniref:Uncharacterized protein n=1 Tax=Thermoflavimicrobium daqui TaxID=2137476 RepID=A0A364K9C6_9BACL|nr:hypothetical protein [Thermoflavimicrobium daqui]RAL26899.1 hypothetical protein DL897_02295 [Thermoflavimicrobium daqui]
MSYTYTKKNESHPTTQSRTDLDDKNKEEQEPATAQATQPFKHQWDQSSSTQNVTATKEIVSTHPIIQQLLKTKWLI